MSTYKKIFDPKSLASSNMIELRLINMEINSAKEPTDEDVNNEYKIDLIFENIFHKDEYSNDVEKYFDKIYHTVLEETGMYLESIELIDNDEIYAWGTIFKEDDKYYVYKPDNTE